MNLCRHCWTTNEGKPGSNHMCGLEHGHIGDHECTECEAMTRQGLPIYNSPKYAVLSGDGFPS